MSFFFMRFHATQRGYHCANCAGSTFLQYNAANAICGWWGLIGLVLTPCIIVMNTVSLVTVCAGGKTPLDHAALAAAGSKNTGG